MWHRSWNTSICKDHSPGSRCCQPRKSACQLFTLGRYTAERAGTCCSTQDRICSYDTSYWSLLIDLCHRCGTVLLNPEWMTCWCGEMLPWPCLAEKWPQSTCITLHVIESLQYSIINPFHGKMTGKGDLKIDAQRLKWGRLWFPTQMAPSQKWVLRDRANTVGNANSSGLITCSADNFIRSIQMLLEFYFQAHPLMFNLARFGYSETKSRMRTTVPGKHSDGVRRPSATTWR